MMRQVPLPAAFLETPLTHRGYHDRTAGRIENSLSAFRAAVDAGYGIELDVVRSADDQAMVFHDDKLDRLTFDSGPVNLRTAEELMQIPLRDGLGDTIPTLSRALALVAGRVPVLIEIKERPDTQDNTDGRLEVAIAATLSGYVGPVAVMSYSPNSVLHMARLAPDVARGLVTESYNPKNYPLIAPEVCDRLREIPDFDRTASSFISHEAIDLDRPRVAELKAQGAVILCWTVRSQAAEKDARRVAQNITFEGYPAELHF